MVNIPSLLPEASSSAFEQALEQSSARIGDVPVKIKSLSRPMEAPSAFLPWLAQGVSVDVWPRRWDETAQREAIRGSLPLHKIKGSAAAIRELIRQAGGAVKRFDRPPSNAFVGANFTDDDRAAWLAHYPELRIYPFRDKSKQPYSFFAGKSFAGVARGPRAAALIPSTAGNRAGRRAFLHDRGVETPLNVTVVTAVEEDRIAVREETIQLKIFKPFTFAANVIASAATGKKFAGGGVGKSTVTLSQSAAYAAIKGDRKRLTVSPGATPIDPTPVERQGRGFLPKYKFFTGVSCVGAGRYATPSTAYLRIYDVVWLYEPGRHVPPRRGRFFSGVTRLGRPAYTADVKVSVRRAPGVRKLFAGGYVNSSHTYPADRSRLDDILHAAASGQSLRDKITLNINCMEIVRASVNSLCGSVICGDQVETQ